jgi:hypothetical protein
MAGVNVGMGAAFRSWMKSRLLRMPTAARSADGTAVDPRRKPGWMRRRLGIDEAHRKWDESDERIRDLYD